MLRTAVLLCVLLASLTAASESTHLAMPGGDGSATCTKHRSPAMAAGTDIAPLAPSPRPRAPRPPDRSARWHSLLPGMFR